MFEFSKGDEKERDGYNMFQKEELGYLFIFCMFIIIGLVFVRQPTDGYNKAGIILFYPSLFLGWCQHAHS